MRAIAGNGLRRIRVGFPSSCCFREDNCCALALTLAVDLALAFACYPFCQMAIFSLLVFSVFFLFAQNMVLLRMELLGGTPPHYPQCIHPLVITGMRGEAGGVSPP